MTELWANGGIADHSGYSRTQLGDGIVVRDRVQYNSAVRANAIFVKALWREIHAMQRRMRK